MLPHCNRYVALLLLPSVSCAEKRVALIIGNGACIRVGTLPNPASDADEAKQLSGFLSDASAHAMDVLV